MGQTSSVSWLAPLSTLCSKHSSEYNDAHEMDWLSEPDAIHFEDMKTPIVTGKDKFGRHFFSLALEFDTKDKTGVWTLVESCSSSSSSSSVSWILCGEDSFYFMRTSSLGEKDKKRLFEKMTSLVSGEWVQLEKSGEPQYVRLSKKKEIFSDDLQWKYCEK